MESVRSLLDTHLPALTEEQKSKLETIADRLAEANRDFNLTSLVSPEEIVLLHFYDSLTLLRTGLFLPGRSVLDVGSGGGFPALPLAVCTDCRIVACDATKKKLDFVAETAKAAGLSGLTTLCGRAEELGRLPGYREKFDLVTARGVARLNILLEWCVPFVAPGGAFVAMKGSRGKEELAEAENAFRVLGCEVESVRDVRIPVFDRSPVLIVFRKTAETDEKYPRANGKIQKKPL